MLKRLAIYIIIGTILTTLPLYYINNVLLSNSVLVIYENKIKNSSNLLKTNYINVKIPQEAKNVSIMYNQDYISYINSGNLYIKNIKNDNLSKKINENNPIIYSLPLDDRNIIIYFTYDNKNLYVKTLNLDDDTKTNQTVIPIKNLFDIKNVIYSNLMNVIYIDAQTLSGKAVNDSIYRIDIMKKATLFMNKKNISEIGLLYDKDTLVYEDSKNNIYIKGKPFKYNKNSTFRLLGIDKNDYIYIVPISNPSQLLILQDGKVKKVKIITNTGYIGVLDKDYNIYLIYTDYILDLQNNKKINIMPGKKIVDINSENLLFQVSKNEVSIEKI